MTSAPTAIVVGAGPNGLTAAVRLARAGVRVRVLEAADRIGGGTRTSELTAPGLLHDDCAAFHPTGVLSPAFADLGLAEFGLRWAWPDIELAHPLDDGSAGLLYRSVTRTAAGLGVDGRRWQRLFDPIARRFGDLTDDVFGPVLGIPSHPLALASFGMRALPPATLLARVFRTEQAKALFGGVAAHAFSRLDVPLSSAVGVMLTAAGHAGGWPVAVGGSRAITDALEIALRTAGGTIETGVAVDSYDQIAGADVTLLGLSPRAAARVLGSRLPRGVRSAYTRYRYGPGVHKVDFAVRGGVPWTNADCARAGTVHLGGTIAEIAAAERAIVAGRMPEAPFVLVGQQYLADPTRSVGDLHPVWAYAHVPAGHGDATDVLVAQIERFAPGFSDRIVDRHVRSTAGMEDHNPNYIEGDISVGANDARQVVFRPRFAVDPYATGVDGVYLCSSATPPGAGVHGMCGWHAAGRALAHLGR